MRVPDIIIGLFFLLLSSAGLRAQQALMDASTAQLLDSLETRITTLERELPRLAQTKSPSWFFKKRELDYTIFLNYYHRFLFDEDLDQAERIVSSRLKGAKKRGDKDAIAFYTAYQKNVAQEIGENQRRYQELFAKEKNFRKEFMRFINQGDEYSIKRAVRMTELAIKYAEERNLKTVLDYLAKYRGIANASLYDLNAEYNLNKITQSEKIFYKAFNPLIESDSLELIMEAGELVKHCINFAENSKSVLDTNFFIMQRNVVNSSISDYHERKGNNADLATLGGQSVVARLDSLNREGIYKWHDNILVVGHFKPDAKFDNVKKGEAIISADHKLTEYIRVNRIAKLKKVVEIGSTYVIPYRLDDTSGEFYFNHELKKYQYMVCYTKIESQYFTKQISKFLPSLQFDVETESP